MSVTENRSGVPTYVSLGDSMSIDDYAGGEGCGAASLLYRNLASDFPDWEGRDLASRYPGIAFLALARDGATSEAVRYVQLPQLIAADMSYNITTLTMGGNDLLQAYGDDAAARVACQKLADNGDAVLTELSRIVGSKGRIVVSTIYDPSDGTGDTNALQIAPWPTALSWIAAFNNVLRRLATKHDAALADAHAAFLGHGIQAGNPANHEARPVNRQLYYCGVVEPNAWGASALRALWWTRSRREFGRRVTSERRVRTRNYVTDKNIPAACRRG